MVRRYKLQSVNRVFEEVVYFVGVSKIVRAAFPFPSLQYIIGMKELKLHLRVSGDAVCSGEGDK